VSAAWATIAALTVANLLIKASGPLALGGRELSPRALRVISLVAPALLAALVIAETFGHDGRLVVDARAAGLAAAVAVLVVRASLVGAVVVAAATAALVRALG
jgi:branched-subunit amino acid transport protein